jgi:hypothetical protein
VYGTTIRWQSLATPLHNHINKINLIIDNLF